MSLNSQQRQQKKILAHKLKPVVLIGSQGLTEAVEREIERALRDHELIKIRLHEADKQQCRAVIQQICENHQAELIQIVGKVGTIYRENRD